MKRMNYHKEKIISIIISLVLCLSFNTNIAYAYQNEASCIDAEALSLVSDINIVEELQNARKGIIDSNVCQKVLDRISFTCNEEDDVSYTVRHLGSITAGEVYTLTASSKKTSDASTNEDTVYCWISMTWIDNFGPENEIVSVSGGWSANGRTLSNREVWYGVARIDGSFGDGMYEVKTPAKDSFYYTPSKPLVGLSLRAYSWVNSAGYPKNILCEVRSSAFD